MQTNRSVWHCSSVCCLFCSIHPHKGNQRHRIEDNIFHRRVHDVSGSAVDARIELGYTSRPKICRVRVDSFSSRISASHMYLRPVRKVYQYVQFAEHRIMFDKRASLSCPLNTPQQSTPVLSAPAFYWCENSRLNVPDRGSPVVDDPRQDHPHGSIVHLHRHLVLPFPTPGLPAPRVGGQPGRQDFPERKDKHSAHTVDCCDRGATELLSVETSLPMRTMWHVFLVFVRLTLTSFRVCRLLAGRRRLEAQPYARGLLCTFSCDRSKWRSCEFAQICTSRVPAPAEKAYPAN